MPLAKRRQTYDKFRKERQRKERKQMKAERKAERRTTKGDEDDPDPEPEAVGDPDLAGIVAGPQPPVDPMTGLPPIRTPPPAPPRSIPE
jgi:hypothetical protein